MISTAARGLCSVDTARSAQAPDGVRVFPPAVAVANLLLCASFEPFLKTDRDGHFHAAFFLILAAVLIALSASYFARRTSVILGRTRTLPVLPHDRFVATLIIEVRRHVVIAMVVSTALFFLFLYRDHPLAATAAVACTLLLAVSIESLMAGVNVIVVRTTHPAMTAVALGGAAVTAVTVGLLVFGTGTLLEGIPLVTWAASGVTAATRGDVAGVLRNSGYIAGVGILIALAGCRGLLYSKHTLSQKSKERVLAPTARDIQR